MNYQMFSDNLQFNMIMIKSDALNLFSFEQFKTLIERCFDLINKNGVIIIEVPNINSFDIKISKKRKLFNYDLPYHLSHFSPKFLKKELQKLGFEIVHINYYQSDFVISFIKILNKVFKKTQHITIMKMKLL